MIEIVDDAAILYTLIQAAWVVAGFVWLLKRHDELPLICSGFLVYIFSIRYWALNSGIATAVNISNFGFAQMSAETAVVSLALGTLGHSVLLLAYMLSQKRNLLVKPHRLSKNSGSRLRRITIILATLIVPLAFFLRLYVGEQKEAGASMAFGLSSYFILFPFAVSGLAILIIAGLKLRAFPDAKSRLSALAFLVVILFVSFGSGARFQFVGWLIAGTVILTSDMRPRKRIPVFGVGFAAAIFAFGIAGALREVDYEEDGAVEVKVSAWERILSGKDANMLDGLELVQQVYPEMLDYGYGMEHLEILTRPIPRAIWPDKPVGGYMNKLKMFDKGSAGTLGISPSLFGSFYGEGGIIGIIGFSAVYGIALARLMMIARRLHPLPGILLRACVCAGIVPLLRGGDLPGIYAWIGMAFWPCGLAIYYCRRELAMEKLRMRTSARNKSRKPARDERKEPGNSLPGGIVAERGKTAGSR